MNKPAVIAPPPPYSDQRLRQAPMMGQPVQDVAIAQPCLARPKHLMDPRKKLMIKLGFTEVTLGGMSFVLSVAALIISSTDSKFRYEMSFLWENDRLKHSVYASSGIWGGLFVIATGSAGISMHCKINTRRLCIVNLAMALMEAAVASVSGTLSALFVSIELRSLSIIHSAVWVLHFTAVIIAICHVITCCAVLYQEPQQNDASVPYEHVTSRSEQLVYRISMRQS